MSLKNLIASIDEKHKTKYLIADGDAEAQFKTIFDYYDVSATKMIENADMTDKEKEATGGFRKIIDSILEGIKLGRIEVCEDSKFRAPYFKLHLKDNKAIETSDSVPMTEIVFKPMGEYEEAHILNVKADSPFKRTLCAQFCDMTGLTELHYGKLGFQDKKYAEWISTFFLAI